MKKTFKFIAALMALVLMLGTFIIPETALSVSAASWPSLSSSSYCEFKATGSINVYRNSSCTTRGTSSPAKSYNAYISKNDVCQIIKITSSYVQLKYPTSSGYKTGYIKRSSLISVSAPTASVTSKGKVNVYTNTSGTYYGYIAKGDRVYTCGTSGSYTRVIYQAKSGSRAYKLGFVKTSDYNSKVNPSSSNSSSSSSSSAKQTVANGTYYLCSALNNNYVVDCSNSGKGNGQNVHLWSNCAVENQKIKVTYLNNGYYKLEFVHSGKCLDVEGNSYACGANVHQWDYVGGTNQQWKIVSAGNGYYYIVARHSGKYLDVSGGNCSNGTNIQVWDGNSTASQKFKFTSVKNSSISLDVPLFKQNDSRWKNTYIGSKTIGAIGCTTTCIAMVYSYHQKSTVYPNKVMSKLSYSNNDLKWASLSNVGLSYKTYDGKVTNDMLSTIYSKLKAGRPVIIGATTSNGKDYQHWVVITGYKGSSTTNFSTSDFIVNDPGSANSTTLAAFLANGNKTDRTYIKKIMY